MSETILLQREGKLSHIPREAWEKHLAHIPDHGSERLSFMSENHHRVRYFIVEELPRSPVGKMLREKVREAYGQK